MNKKNIIGIVALVLVLTIVTSIVVISIKNDREIYVDDDGVEHWLVTDEFGNTTLSKSGDMVVYATDENGKILEDENGEPEYRYVKFPDMVIKDNTLETPDYKITMPDSWVLEDDGTYHKKDNEDITLTIASLGDYNGNVDEYMLENKEYYEEVLKVLEEEYGDIQMTTGEYVLTMKNIYCHTEDYKIMKDGNIDIYTKAFYFVENDEIFKITYTCWNGSYDESIKIEGILDDSFVIKTITADY